MSEITDKDLPYSQGLSQKIKDVLNIKCQSPQIKGIRYAQGLTAEMNDVPNIKCQNSQIETYSVHKVLIER